MAPHGAAAFSRSLLPPPSHFEGYPHVRSPVKIPFLAPYPVAWSRARPPHPVLGYPAHISEEVPAPPLGQAGNHFLLLETPRGSPTNETRGPSLVGRVAVGERVA